MYDLIKDCDVLNQYVKITIDLSAYQSDRMRVAFHAYDTNDVGLSYWWQIDDVEIYSAPSETWWRVMPYIATVSNWARHLT